MHGQPVSPQITELTHPLREWLSNGVRNRSKYFGCVTDSFLQPTTLVLYMFSMKASASSFRLRATLFQKDKEHALETQAYASCSKSETELSPQDIISELLTGPCYR